MCDLHPPTHRLHTIVTCSRAPARENHWAISRRRSDALRLRGSAAPRTCCLSAEVWWHPALHECAAARQSFSSRRYPRDYFGDERLRVPCGRFCTAEATLTRASTRQSHSYGSPAVDHRGFNVWGTPGSWGVRIVYSGALAAAEHGSTQSAPLLRHARRRRR